ncbi:hypothetical protein SKAU_G00417640 [Synaphobranchus kaupii]|uniref:Ig-like domain-containing protein n=1 Tax=Synaphobranchus kaupii TaxID=118154 RepID=A0A9Q1E5Y2_SYNKA|nr:hypothetical protein SKAU_G00417640 [Synaphobranchus kaupii]
MTQVIQDSVRSNRDYLLDTQLGASVSSVTSLLKSSDVHQCGWSEGVAETAAGSCSTVKRVGESIQFPVSLDANQSYRVDLIFNTFTIVTWYPQMFSVVREQYKGRISTGNNSVWLNKLHLSDSGLYRVKIEHRSGGFKPPEYTDFHLQVFELVSKPNITTKSLGDNVSLSCFSSQGSEVTYSWETLPPCGDDGCVHQNRTIYLQLQSLPPCSTYTCTAHNPVSRATSDSIGLGMCSSQRLQGRWVPVLCASTAFVFGVLLLLCKWKKQKRYKSETIQVKVDEHGHGGGAIDARCTPDEPRKWSALGVAIPTRTAF